MEIQFQSRWLERGIRDYLGIEGEITKEDLSVIKYLFVSTTHEYLLGFSKDVPPRFDFSDAGDEWWCCCLSDTGKYHDIGEFIDIEDWGDRKVISIKRTLLDEEEFEVQQSDNDGTVMDEKAAKQAMKDFQSSIKFYNAEDSDFEGLERDEETYDYGILVPEDFAYLTNLEVVRLMSCETEIHNLAFLQMLPKLRVLEVGEVRLDRLDGLEKLRGLEKLCIWSN